MAKVKVITSSVHLMGQKVTTLFGVIEYDNNLVAEVDDSIVKDLIATSEGKIQLYDETKGTFVKEVDVNAPVLTEDEQKKKDEEEKKAKQHQVMLALMNKDMEVLIKMANTAKLPEDEWNTLKKPELCVYLSQH